jgi:SAM-dependent methyltransferase
MGYQPNPQAPGYWLYDGLPVQAEVEVHKFALQAARRLARSGAHVLDIAAGHGALSKALIDAGFNVACTSWNENVGLPIPRYRIDLDKRFESDDVGARQYDLICALEIIEHVENPAQMLRSISGVMQEGGILILSTPNVESAQARLEWLLRGCPYAFSGAEIVENRHISILWRQGLESFIHLAGFDIVQRQMLGAFRFSGPVQAVVRRILHSIMRNLLPGDLEGASRAYVLKKTTRSIRILGAEDVA